MVPFRVRKATLIAAIGLATFGPLIAAAQDGYRIAGTVVNAVGGSPLARVRITVFKVGNRQNARFVVTSEDGHFEFTQLGPGKYSLQGAKRGFIESAYDQHEQFSTAIVTGAGLDTEHLVLRLPPFAVLSGKVLDESGEPVRKATVSLYREDRQTGVGRTQKIQTANTDDRGSYELVGLLSGNYFLAVSTTPWYALHPAASVEQNTQDAPSAFDPALDVAYPVTYYKDATAPDDATPIPIRGGDHLEVDLHLNPVPALRLLFHPPDNGEHGFNSPLIREPAFDGMEQVPYRGGMDMVSPGVYAMTGIPAGHYTVRTYGSPAEGSPTKEVEIDITQDGQELDTSKGEPASTVKVSVQLAEALPRPLVLALRNSKMRVVASNQVSDKGETEFQNVPPGKYEVLAQGLGKAYAVVRVTSDGGKDIAGNILNVATGSSPTVFLTIVGSSVKVEGFVKRNGQPVAGAMVVLVPKNPESNHRQFRRDQSDQDGSFALPGVIPGAYTVVAIEDGWDLDWSSPGVIAHYCQHGQPVTVEGLNETSLHLPGPLELQPK
jgi:5-hydroxyisourate hydrolase-like protein (transthyretin family)